MGWYIAKLLLLLPLLAGLIWGSLWLARKVQGGVGTREGGKAARLVETTMLAPGMRLAVIEFHGREILVGASRQGLVRLAEAEARPRAVQPIAANEER
ncbi:flagellar biosynthetic protein FliO [Alteraurantiacibacter aquimixticola]|uniref:Flagellar biogenesis protein n=1 Tax=Alteraurantiacibacter aquimixticola TaxID=2489173 RepID=A0A4V4U9L7_9SPHN|nr:flagellar biosynthetic protein FliO [Alteraurantiacibacter aquimixticola]TIX51537.1 flagellar biogenesis protein [Alteraurantiacibacter aquimixticola]